MQFNQKGISLVFTLLVLTLVLGVSTGISSLIIRQLRLMRGVGSSITSFYAADSGIERTLLLGTPVDNSGAVDDAGYEVTVENGGQGGCEAPNYCIKSVGSYKGTRRAIEVTF